MRIYTDIPLCSDTSQGHHPQRLAYIVLVVLLFCVSSTSLAQSDPITNLLSETRPEPLFLPFNEQLAISKHTTTNIKGWDHLYHQLRAKGFNPYILQRIFSDPRFPPNETVYFHVNPKESRHLYRGHNTANRRKNALKFYLAYADVFQAVEQKYQVPQEVILSILQVETQCGVYTGTARVLPKIARLAAVADPDSIIENLSFNQKLNRKVTLSDVTSRALWLENTFLPHVAASFVLAERYNIDPLELRGSPAGAIGLPQFLPGNVIDYGADGNKDGKVDIFCPEDAIASVGNFLKNKGWDALDAEYKKRHEVILEYNKSIPYADTVLAMSKLLAVNLPSVADKHSSVGGNLSLLLNGSNKANRFLTQRIEGCP